MLLIKFIITLQNFFVADVSTNIYIGVAITNEIHATQCVSQTNNKSCFCRQQVAMFGLLLRIRSEIFLTKIVVVSRSYQGML